MMSHKGFDRAESNEHQRQWTKEQKENVEHREKHSIDWTRQHLNFEIGKGGVVQDLGTDKPINIRYKERLAAVGIEDPNAPLLRAGQSPRFRTVAEIILSGNRDRMRELAFGDQQVVFRPGADNSHIMREVDIEKWAVDQYKKACELWGEDNIIGFSVHCDESSPHIHLCVLPIGQNKRGVTSVNYRDTFGGEGAKLFQYHDAFAEVNRKWGLERGEPVSKTGARHICRDEWLATLRDREEEIQDRIDQKVKALKGLTTMIENLTTERNTIVGKINVIEDWLKRHQNDDDPEVQEQVKILKQLRESLSRVDEKLEDKRSKLMEVDSTIADYKNQLEVLRSQMEVMKDAGLELENAVSSDATILLKASIFDELLTQAKFLVRDDPKLQAKTNDTFIDDANFLRWNDVLESGVKALIAGIDGATTVAQGGGGGTSSDLPWRDKDEDYLDFARRCMRFAHVKHYPNRSRMNYRRH